MDSETDFTFTLPGASPCRAISPPESFFYDYQDVCDEGTAKMRLLNSDVDSIYPTFTEEAQPGLGTPSPAICPILSGLTSDCIPDYCGPNPPCENLEPVPEIEEAAMFPCLNPASQMETFCYGERAGRVDRTASSQLYERSTIKSTVVQEGIVKCSNPSSKSGSKLKHAHSLVERKYRENLNSKIGELHLQLQSVKFSPGFGDSGSHGKTSRLASSTIPVRKSDVLVEAIQYVNQAEVEMRHMADEITQLRTTVASLRKLVNCNDCSILKKLKYLKLHAKQ